MSAATAGRLVGVLLLVQGSMAPVVNFRLLRPLNTGGPGFLTDAALSAPAIRAAVLLGLVTGAITVAIAIVLWPLLGRGRSPLALWLLGSSLVGMTVLVAENVAILTMLSLSQSVASGVATRELAVASAIAVQGGRRWAHYIGLIIAGGTIFVFYLGMWRYALIPRALGLFGMLAALLHTSAVTMPLLGQPMVFSLLAPIGLSHLALAVVLLRRGFRDPSRALPASAGTERLATV
jgi:hypothetical protein